MTRKRYSPRTIETYSGITKRFLSKSKNHSAKDRELPLSDIALEQLRVYYKANKPND